MYEPQKDDGGVKLALTVLAVILVLIGLACCGCAGTRYTFGQSITEHIGDMSIVTGVEVSSSRMLTEAEVNYELDRIASIARKVAGKRMRQGAPSYQAPEGY